MIKNFFIDPKTTAVSLISSTPDGFKLKICAQRKMSLEGDLSDLSVKGREYQILLSDTHIQDLTRDKNRRDLLVVVNMLELLDENVSTLAVYTDNKYVNACINEWIKLWEITNFISNKNEPRPNADLLRVILSFMKKINITARFIYDPDKFGELVI